MNMFGFDALFKRKVDFTVTPITMDWKYLQSPKSTMSDFWRLSPFYIHQTTHSSCSVASTVMIMNALLRTGKPYPWKGTNVTHEKILEKVQVEDWKKKTMDGGDGVTLDALANICTEALKKYGFSDYTIEKKTYPEDIATSLDELRADLAANESNDKEYMLLHYRQELAVDLNGVYAHVSPVGAYDAATDRVLIMDVDREWFGPYWISVVKLHDTLMTPTKKYGDGGIIWFRKK